MFEKPVGGYALQQHVFKHIHLSMGIKPYSDCKNRCLMEDTCVSVNVGPPSKNGLRVCQLSDSDHIQHPITLRRIPVLGFKGIDIWIEHNTIDSFSNFPWYGDTEFLL